MCALISWTVLCIVQNTKHNCTQAPNCVVDRDDRESLRLLYMPVLTIKLTFTHTHIWMCMTVACVKSLWTLQRQYEAKMANIPKAEKLLFILTLVWAIYFDVCILDFSDERTDECYLFHCCRVFRIILFNQSNASRRCACIWRGSGNYTRGTYINADYMPLCQFLFIILNAIISLFVSLLFLFRFIYAPNSTCLYLHLTRCDCLSTVWI